MKPLSFLASSCLTLSCLILAAPSQAASVSFETPAIAGSGCSFGSFSYSTKSIKNGQVLTLRTNGFRARPGNVTCNLALPVKVPNGYRVTEIHGVYSGYAKGRAELRRSYFLAGDTNPILVSQWISSTGRVFTQLDKTKLKARCGEDVNVRLNSRLRTTTSASSARISAMLFTVHYTKCTS
ncbi:protein of unknown function [Thiothrix eikelboomii]|uniref:DUF4360 domain-containing protein n=2 Tax=Thiothrix eikelboomii TaxID=92487 RepID=A0A1T4Y197_9GAMM|nr:protein of unknown function [Thiothrix eikelboomii]